jgi:hypothetical protein
MARPMMDREDADADLAIVVGPGMGGRKAPRAGMGGMEPDGNEMGGDMEEELPAGFESAALEAFPDMDPAGYPALKRLIALCMESPEY